MFSNQPYVPLCFSSYFNLLKGCLSPEEICNHAKVQGYKGVGLADENNLYGMMRFISAAKNAGIKPVIGVKICFPDRELFTAYIRNRQGFALINRLISSVHKDIKSNELQETDQAHRRDNAISFVLKNGWNGLTLVSDDRVFLEEVKGKKNVFVKLLYNRPYMSHAVWARKNGFPVIALNNALYINRNDRNLFNVLRAIDLNITVDNLPAEEGISSEDAESFLAVSAGKMSDYFSGVPEALSNAYKLFLEVETENILRKNYIFPCFNGMPEQAAYLNLKQLCETGINERYGKCNEAVSKRLEYELDIIRKKKFSGYFLVVHDIVSRCPRTCGRGSSASSIVSYLLGITHVDPLKYNLFFERFLNAGRKDPPDIDVDFPWDERKNVFSYVFSKYEGQSGMVANHVTFGPRSSVHETAKAFGIPEDEIKKIIRHARLGKREAVPPYIDRTARRIRGFPHYISMHCGGVVITPGPITDYTHVEPSIGGYPVIAWEKEGTEEAGLVKIDLLGNRSLAVLRDSIELLRSRGKEELDWNSFNPIDDNGTRRLIESGNTLGIFYIESPATRQLLKKMRHGSFEHIVIASSIIRPAANVYIREFVERLHGKPYKPLHKLIKKTLKETFGIMVYQEDVSRVAIATAGFTPEEADLLRKIIAKKNKHLKLEILKKRFFEGGKKSGIEAGILEQIWEMINSFKGYSFCKAHSASYALVSYKLAYIKNYYPEEFIVSVINNGGGFYMCQTYLNEAKRMGIPILGPDINRSGYKYTLEGNSIRIGFCQLKELSITFVEKIIDQRKRGGRFRDFFDFVERLYPHLPEIRVLIKAGVMDSVSEGLNRPQLFWLFFYAERHRELFLTPPVPDFIGDYTFSRKQFDEIHTMGIMISRHPLRIFQEKIRNALKTKNLYPFISSRYISENVNKRVTLAGITVTGKEVRTKNNRHMIFVSFEDPYSIYETVFFPNAYRRFYTVLDRTGAFLVCGKVTEEYGALTLDVDRLVPLSVR